MSSSKLITIGIVLLILGVQFRMVDTFVLNQETSQFVASRMKQSAIRSEGASFDSLLLSTGPVPRKQLTHPRWFGWAFVSAGAVLLLHGLSARKSG